MTSTPSWRATPSSGARGRSAARSAPAASPSSRLRVASASNSWSRWRSLRADRLPHSRPHRLIGDRLGVAMKVHLVDGTYELFRHFFGAPPHRNADGQEVAAVRGVVSSVLQR